jgi:hypothetical protein
MPAHVKVVTHTKLTRVNDMNASCHAKSWRGSRGISMQVIGNLQTNNVACAPALQHVLMSLSMTSQEKVLVLQPEHDNHAATGRLAISGW